MELQNKQEFEEWLKKLASYIDKGKYSELFKALKIIENIDFDKPILAHLRSEYLLDKTSPDYHERLKTFLDTIELLATEAEIKADNLRNIAQPNILPHSPPNIVLTASVMFTLFLTFLYYQENSGAKEAKQRLEDKQELINNIASQINKTIAQDSTSKAYQETLIELQELIEQHRKRNKE